MITYRIAKKTDLRDIVNIRHEVRDINDRGIFVKMGKPFLKSYYKIIIEDPYTVCICAEKDSGEVVGFCFATIDAKRFSDNIKKHKVALSLAALLSVVEKPSLLKELWLRYKSLNKGDTTYINQASVRGGFWGWNPSSPDSESSCEMHERMLLTVYDLGYDSINLEVDKENKIIYKYHKLNGASTIGSTLLPDGRHRVMMRYDLSKRRTLSI